MVKMNVYGPDGQIIDSTELSDVPPLNDPHCKHPADLVVEVDDPMPGVVAKKCTVCNVGWLIRQTEKIKGEQ